MFDRIVVGTDGSETAAEAVRTAIELAKMTGARLEIVSAYEPVPQARLKEEGRGSAATSRTSSTRARTSSSFSTRPQRGQEGEGGGRHPPARGDPADAILDVAEENKADLILVGNKGMTGARRFLLGSVPNKISHHAPCDVWIVRTT